jgi:RNA recognition motif-containing protein
MKLFVGNLSFDTSSEDLRQAFSAHGQVTSADVITDRDTGRSRGFGFVEMESRDEAQTAISRLDGQQLQGRTVTVNEAKPKAAGASRGGGGGYNSRRW